MRTSLPLSYSHLLPFSPTKVEFPDGGIVSFQPTALRLASDVGVDSDEGESSENEDEKKAAPLKEVKPLIAKVSIEQIVRIPLRQHGYLLCCTVDSEEEEAQEYFEKYYIDDDDDGNVEEEEDEEEEPVCEASCEVWDDPQSSGGGGGGGGTVRGGVSSQQRRGSDAGQTHTGTRSTKEKTSHGEYNPHFRTRAGSTRRMRAVRKPAKYEGRIRPPFLPASIPRPLFLVLFLFTKHTNVY